MQAVADDASLDAHRVAAKEFFSDVVDNLREQSLKRVVTAAGMVESDLAVTVAIQIPSNLARDPIEVDLCTGQLAMFEMGRR